MRTTRMHTTFIALLVGYRTYHRTQAKNGHGRIGLYLTGIPNGAQTGRNATAEQTDLLEGGLWIDLGARDLSDDGVFGHGAASARQKETQTSRIQ